MGWKIIDKQGRIFGKISLIDFLVLLFIVCLMPILFFAYKIMTKEVVVVIETTYKVYRPCPVCGNSIFIDLSEDSGYKGILKGEPLPEFYEAVCGRCENKVVLIKLKPKPLVEEMNYMQEYYKRMLEQGKP